MNVPIINKTNWLKLKKPNPIIYLTIFNKLAPAITGMAIKKENSLATYLEHPQCRPPKIVAPDRDVPGINARHWKNPIFKEVR